MQGRESNPLFIAGLFLTLALALCAVVLIYLLCPVKLPRWSDIFPPVEPMPVESDGGEWQFLLQPVRAIIIGVISPSHSAVVVMPNQFHPGSRYHKLWWRDVFESVRKFAVKRSWFILGYAVCGLPLELRVHIVRTLVALLDVRLCAGPGTRMPARVMWEQRRFVSQDAMFDLLCKKPRKITPP